MGVGISDKYIGVCVRFLGREKKDSRYWGM